MNAWIDILLNATVKFLLNMQLPGSQVASALRSLADRIEASEPIVPLHSPQEDHLVEVAGVINDWRDDSAFTDRTGSPRPLRLDTLRALIQQRVPQHEVDATIDWLCDNGTIERRDDGAYVLRPSGIVLISHSDASYAYRISTIAAKYLATVRHNARTPDRSQRDVEQAAHVNHFPVQLLPEYRAKVKNEVQKMNLIIDNYLEDNNAPNADPSKTTRVTLHSFSHVGSY